ncbi:unnamed protein product [Schistosoma curassoni]|uniref:Endo/exonuclease/phosphatase domain-containing protein n=1 Tax=Schistosoma curassoni TaxID=6186 RepID=A0A183L312_9TREM|nr:unnamed protein product [Schistosoma curassoni]
MLFFLFPFKLIARYELDRMLDKYNGHRISQLVEIMEFVRMTSTGSDAIIITGDFNLESNTSAIELFSTSLKLSDAWLNNVSLEYIYAVFFLQKMFSHVSLLGNYENLLVIVLNSD